MPEYQFDDVIVEDTAPDFQSYLAEAHAQKTRPLCLCLPKGAPMYVARAGQAFAIKRMPNSGTGHAAGCNSYQPPAELSGMAQVFGEAISENADDGTTTLKLDFSLSKTAGRVAPAPGGEHSDTVRADGAKLTLRSTLHFLWDAAELNRWTPGMAGKRSWYVVRSRLLAAAANCTSKGSPLKEVLYVPEPYIHDQAANIRQRRIAQMSFMAGNRKTRKLMIAVGEIKEISASRFGHKLVVKHCPDFPLMLDDDIHNRFQKRFANELALRGSMEDSHLMFIATISLTQTGIAKVETLAAMICTSNWIPFETTYDAMLLDALTAQKRRFFKGLRFNLPESKPLACAVLSDNPILPEGIAMYIQKPGNDNEQQAALEELIEASNLPVWKWNAAEEMPALPHVVSNDATRAQVPPPSSHPEESAW